MKEEKELVLYPNKNGSVDDLLDEARKQVELAEGGSDKLRSVECSYFLLVLNICIITFPSGDNIVNNLVEWP